MPVTAAMVLGSLIVIEITLMSFHWYTQQGEGWHLVSSKTKIMLGTAGNKIVVSD